MRALFRDFRHASRVFARRPALTVVAVLSLAVATGPNAALFGLVHGLFFRHLPVQNPEELVGVRSRGDSLTYPDWRDIREHASSFASVITWERTAFPVSLNTQTQLMPGNVVSADYFTTLGLKPAAGRLLSTERDDRPQTDLPIVISYACWQRQFGGAASAIGAITQVAGRPFVIVGVAPAAFRGLDFHFPVDGWIPLSAAEVIGKVNARVMADREHGRLESVLGRLRPGATIEQVQAEVDRIVLASNQTRATSAGGRSFHTFSYVGERSGRGLTIGGLVLTLVGLVLLVACANVAGLLLSLAEVRRREVAVRIALGASRWQLVRQFLVEAILIWLAGAVAGLVLAACLMRIPLAPPVGTVMLDYDIHFDSSIYLYTLGLALLTAVIFGLAPALQATAAARAGLKSNRGDSRLSRPRTRAVLVAAQIAVSQFLLAGAVLFARSYVNVADYRPGFDVSKSVLAVTVAPRVTGQSIGPARRTELVEGLRSIPGVVHVSGANSLPLSGSGGGLTQVTSWAGASSDVKIRANFIRAQYFDTMGIRLLGGRDFDAQDDGALKTTVIVNATLARQIAPDGTAIGRWLRVEGVPRQVIGVAEDGRYVSMRDASEPYLYLPASSTSMLLLETTDGAPGVTEAVYPAVAGIAPDLYIADVTTLKDVMRFARYADGLGAWLIGGLGLLAAFLTAVGVYGMVSHSVASRTREFGIRMALGADRRRILSMVLRHGLRLAAIGAPIGLTAALVGGGISSHLLFGLSSLDPISYLTGLVVLLSIVALAGFNPALRASSVQPSTALRHD